MFDTRELGLQPYVFDEQGWNHWSVGTERLDTSIL